MRVQIVNYVGKYSEVPGPADLSQYGAGDTVVISDAKDEDVARWANAIGRFIMRGGEA